MLAIMINCLKITYSIYPTKLYMSDLIYYRKIYNTSRTKSQNLTVSRLVLQLFCVIYWSQLLSG